MNPGLGSWLIKSGTCLKVLNDKSVLNFDKKRGQYLLPFFDRYHHKNNTVHKRRDPNKNDALYSKGKEY